MKKSMTRINSKDNPKILMAAPLPLKDSNGISIHCREIIKNIKFKVEYIYAKGIHIPGFSSQIIPILSIKDLLLIDYDILHAHGINLFSFFAITIAKLRRKKTVLTVHGIPKPRGIGKYLFKVFKLLIIPILKTADVIISVSGENFYGKKTVLIPNGVNEMFFKCKNNYKKNEYICYVGRLDKDKGISYLSSIANHYKLLLIGKDEGMLKKLKFNYEHTVVQYNEMPNIYCKKCKYVVLPSNYEGFPLVLLESLASGIPFLCTDVGYAGIMLKKLNLEEFIIKQDNIKEKLDELEKRDLRKKIENAKKIIRLYTWKSIVKKIEEIYKELYISNR